MLRWIIGCALPAVYCAGGAVAQERAPSTDQLLEQLRRLNERVEGLEVRHEADQQRILNLEARLQQIEDGATDQKQQKPDTERQTAETSPPAPKAPPGPFDLSASGLGAANAYNPQMTVFIDTGGSLSSKGSNKALNRFNLREVELDLRAAISPQADGVLVLAIPEEIESGPDGDIEISRSLEIEEAFVNFHTFPHDTALKFGKFRSPFGRNNLLHTHDLPQVTRPLALQAFLGPEGLSSTGASFSWLVPNPWDQYVELTAEIINADGGEEAPILGGPNADNPALLTHLKLFRDVAVTSSIEAGATYLYTHTTEDHEFDANVFGLDAAYTWTHPDPGKFRSFLLQGEVYYARNDLVHAWFGPTRNSSLGAYAFAQYQLDRDWYVGLRGDYTEFPNSASRRSDDWDAAFSPYLTWYVTEFLRLRIEYQHRLREIVGDHDSEEALSLQLTGVFGSHPAHPYWVHR